MFRATEEIYNAFQEADLTCEKDTVGETSYVMAGVSGRLTEFKVLFISKDDDNDVSMRIYQFARFDEEKTGSVLTAANYLNRKFRFAKFVVDIEESTVDIEIDFPISCDDVGKIAIEMIVRIMKMADEAYGEFMKAIWAS